MFGYRPDGRRLDDIDPIVRITPYLMPMRCDAQVFLEQKLDYELLARYIAEKAKEGHKVTFMQIVVAAYVRAISQHPEINRFVYNRQYYSRNNCSVSYTVLRESQNHDSPETTVRVEFDLTDTLFDVVDRMNTAVSASRDTEDDTFVIKLANFALSVPGLATLLVAIVKLLDRYGLLPKVLMRELPFYSSMFITNNGSIGLHHVWHHIYNFGNVSMFLGMGSPMKEATVESNGQVRNKRWIPMGITADERVTSGAHYAAFYADFLRAINHPETLEVPPETVRFDPKVSYHVPKVGQQTK